MKKRKKLILIALAVVVLLLSFAVVLLILGETLPPSPNCRATVSYYNEYTGVYFKDALTDAELELVENILKNVREPFSTGIPGCGFSREVSITVDGKIFGIALDQCGILWDYSTWRAIHITDAERELLEAIFTSRGGSFPCI